MYENLDPVQALKLYLKTKNLKQADFIGVIGNKSTVSRVINYKLRLSLNMIKRLKEFTDIPSEILIQEYTLK